jgi:hypothetical protein
LKAFPLYSGKRQGCPLSWLLFNIVLEFLPRAIKQEDDIKIQICKEIVKISLSADDMILYLKDPKNSTQKHLQLQQCNRIQNQLTKISSLSIHQKWPDWKRIQENNSIYNSIKKKIKYLGINLMKDINDLYKEYYKTLKKEM